MQSYHVIGLMSGTSLDGLDIAYCMFENKRGKWQFSIKKASTYGYNAALLKKLKTAHNLTGEELLKLHNEYGEYIGVQVKKFMKANRINKIDFVASHGHTVFHQPHEKFTFQLGNGAFLAVACGASVISDFRNLDVALNGQGAPLVPIGDKLLFPEYKFCINLGGFANISYNKNGKRIAFDICPVNIALNHFAAMRGNLYDKNGAMAATGKVDMQLLQKLNALAYYKQPTPKSLSREWFEKIFLPTIDKFLIAPEDKLATLSEHIALQIANAVNVQTEGSVLLTGGGAFNTYLVKQLRSMLSGYKIIVPPILLVNYKEALIFAFLGVLRHSGKVNVLSSVTGASRDNIGGAVYSI